MPSFGNPSALLWSLLIAPLVVLYLRNQRLRRHFVSAVLFWETSPSHGVVQPGRRRLHHRISLLLLSLAIICGALAAAEPQWRWWDSSAATQSAVTDKTIGDLKLRSTILVIDNSASMNVRDCDQRTRFEMAIEFAETIVATKPELAEISIVTTAPQLTVQCRPHASQSELLKSLNRLESTDASGGPNSIWSSLVSAASVDSQASQIVVITDELPIRASRNSDEATGRSEGAGGENADQLQVHWHRLGESQENIAIAGLRWKEREPSQESSWANRAFLLEVDVQNGSPGLKQTELNILLDGEPFDVIPVELGPDSMRTMQVEFPSEVEGLLTVSVSTVDVMPVDNSVSISIVRGTPVDAVLVTSGNIFLQRAIESNERISLRVFDQQHLNDVIQDPPKVLILDEPTAETFTALDQLRVPSLVVLPQTFSAAVIAGPVWVYDAPGRSILKELNSPELKLSKAISVESDGIGYPVLQSAEGQPLLIATSHHGAPRLLMGFDPTADDLPVRAVFPALVQLLIDRYLLSRAELPICRPTGEKFPLPGISLTSASVHSRYPSEPGVCTVRVTGWNGVQKVEDCRIVHDGLQAFLDLPPIVGQFRIDLRETEASSSEETSLLATTGILNAQESHLFRADPGEGVSNVVSANDIWGAEIEAKAGQQRSIVSVLICLALTCLAAELLHERAWSSLSRGY